jgi:O-antigen/teichoic acid export membrane protein
MLVLTHLLSPAEYGTYALVLASVAVVNAIAFQWLRSGARRFLAAGEHLRAEVLPTIGVAYGTIVLVAAGVILLAVPVLRSHVTSVLLLLGGCLLVVQTWYELNTEIVLAEINPSRYGAVALSRALIAAGLGVTLCWLGFGATGALVGAIAGFTLPGLALCRLYWRGLGRLASSRSLLTSLLAYGGPLTASYALQFVMDSADRLLLGWLASTAAVGIYAVAYDLSQQSINFAMVAVNLAAFPMAVRALETESREAALAQLRIQIVLLALLALPGAVGLTLLAPQIGTTLLGERFSSSAAALVPIIVAGAACCGFKAFYFDLAFQLAKQTRPLILIGAVGAVLNTVLNLLLIPGHGPAGAAIASTATFAVALLASAALGRPLFPLPFPWIELAKVGLITLVMALIVKLVSLPLSGSLALWIPLAAGIAVVAAGTLTLDVAGARRWWSMRPAVERPGRG